MGIAIGAVSGCLLTLGGLKVAHRVSGTDPLGPPGSLVIASGQDDSPSGERKALVDVWNAMNPEHQAKIDVIAEPANGQHTEMINRTSAVDIYNLDVTWTAEFVKKDLLRPLDMGQLPQGFLAGFLRKPLSTGRYGNRQWALPFNTDAGLMFYRSDLLKRSDLFKQGSGNDPTDRLNWATIQDQTRHLAELGKRDSRLEAGYTGQLKDYEGLTVNGLEALWAAGATVFSQPTGQDPQQVKHVVVQPPLWRAGLGWLSTPRLVLPTPDDEHGSIDEFSNGKVLFMRNWPIAYQVLKDGDASGKTTLPLPGVALLPGHSVLGGQNLAIANHSTHPRAAQALIQFLTAEPSQRLLFERGGFAATRTAVYQDDGVQLQVPFTKTLLQAITDAYLRPVTPYYTEFSSVFREGVCYALKHGGQVPPDLGSRLNAALAGREVDPQQSSC